MQNVRKIFLYCLIVLSFNLFGNTSFAQEVSRVLRPNVERSEQDYYFAFTEATRYFMTGNYIQAVNLYNECLRIKSSSGAPHYQLSRIFLNAGNNLLALEHAKKAVAFDKSNKWYLQGLANIYQIEGKKDSAVVVLKQLLLLDGNNPSYLMNIAGLNEELGRLDSSMKYLDLIERKIGTSKEVSLKRYQIYESMRLSDKALGSLNKAYSLDTSDYVVSGMLAEFYRGRSQADSAAKYYSRIYPEYKSEPMVSYSYAEFLLELHDTVNARDVLLETMKDKKTTVLQKSEYFLKLIQNKEVFDLNRPILDTIANAYLKEYPNDIRALSVYSDLQIRQRNYKRATAVLIRVYELDRRNYLALEQLLYTLNILGKSDSVFLFSEEGLKSFTDRPLIYLFNGSAKNDLKKFSEALVSLNRGLSIVTDSAMKVQFYNLLADSYRNLGEYAKSDDAFEKALLIDPVNIVIRNNYAYYLSVRGERLKVARKMSRQTLKVEPENATYLDTYAWILFRMKKISKAQRYITLALNHSGDQNSEILLHAGEIFLKARIYDKALIYYKKAITLLQGTERQDAENRINAIMMKQ